MINDPRMAVFAKNRKKAETVGKVEKSSHTTDTNTLSDQHTDGEAVDTSSFTGPGAKLIDITKSLTSLIKQETIHLLNHQTQDAAQLHGKKTTLMSQYKNTLNHLQLNEHLLGPKQSPLRKFIRKMTDDFRDALKEHARVVLRMKSISEGIIKSIGEEVTKKNRPVLSYGANAAFRAPQQAIATSISLNQVI